jgi:hypothetical protein
LDVPRVTSRKSGKSQHPFNANCYRPSRRPGTDILEELAQDRELARKQAPPLYSHGKKLGVGNRELEKTKLQMCFQFKGGKALPEEGLPGKSVSQVPLNLILRKPARRTGASNASEANEIYSQNRRRMRDLEASFDKVMADIDSAKKQLSNARGAKIKADLLSELDTLITESKTLDDLIRHEKSSLLGQ